MRNIKMRIFVLNKDGYTHSWVLKFTTKKDIFRQHEQLTGVPARVGEKQSYILYFTGDGYAKNVAEAHEKWNRIYLVPALNGKAKTFWLAHSPYLQGQKGKYLGIPNHYHLVHLELCAVRTRRLKPWKS